MALQIAPSKEPKYSPSQKYVALLSPYFSALPCTWCLHTGVSRKSQELLQFGRSSCTQSLAVRVQRETAEEEGHEICELVGDKAVVVC